MSKWYKLFYKPIAFGLLILLYCIYAAPATLICIKHISPLVYASEAIGYRYFYSYRLLNGQYENILLPQGHSMGLLQHAVVAAMDRLGIPPNALRLRLDGFAYATILGAIIITGIALTLAACRKPLNFLALVLVGIVPVAAVYVCRSGISSIIGADYYSYEIPLAILALAVALPYFGMGMRSWTKRVTISFGLILGVMLGIKPTLIAVGVLCCWAALSANDDEFWIVIKRCITIFTIATVTWLGILMIYYFPHPFYVVNWFQWFLKYSASAGAEPAFWQSLLAPGSPGANPGADYGYARVMAVFWITAMAAGLVISLVSNPIYLRGLLITGLAIVLGGMQMVALMIRPAGTTLWEIHLYWLCSAVVVLSMLPPTKIQRGIICFWIGVLLIFCAFSAPPRLAELMSWSRLAESTSTIWKVHEYLSEIQGTVALIFPNNNHTCGSVEEAILKGFSDHPSWNITSGAELLKTVAPYYHYYQDVPPVGANAYFWIDSKEASLPSQITTFLQKIILQSGKMVTWETTTFPWWQRHIHVFSVAPFLSPNK